jgi:hypothetical protein
VDGFALILVGVTASVKDEGRTCHSARAVPTKRPFSLDDIHFIAFTSSEFIVNATALSSAIVPAVFVGEKSV